MSHNSILIVDDEPHIRELMTRVISKLGHNCRTAADGLEALDLIENNNFDIVFSDIFLPKIDGIELMERVKDKNLETQFIIITGYGNEYSYDRVIKAGAVDFIKKPFTTEELKSKLTRIIYEIDLKKKNLILQKKQDNLIERLSTLMEVASSLISELDFDRLFQLIIGKVTEAMAAERTSLYIIDWEKRELWTKVAENINQFRLPLGEGISGRVAESGKTINIKDAWDLTYYNREFDLKHNFRTRSVLCIPIKNRDGERIGVLQVINKKDCESFNEDDEIFMAGLASQVGIALENAFLHEELRLSFDSSILALSATVDARHPLTAGHSRRVTEYSLLIAKEMGLDFQGIEVLRYAALLHDIGKIGIKDNVLLKNGPFNDEERAEMNKHPVKTRSILDKFRFPRALKDVPEIACHHHEKMNGEGYPDGLKKNELPIGSRIIAVADVFDALTSKRDYPKYNAGEVFKNDPMPISKVISILKNDSDTHFDPNVVNAFLRCLPQALLLFRGTHFPPDYIDDTIRSLAPELLI